jgi:hypothetical protein
MFGDVDVEAGVEPLRGGYAVGQRFVAQGEGGVQAEAARQQRILPLLREWRKRTFSLDAFLAFPAVSVADFVTERQRVAGLFYRVGDLVEGAVDGRGWRGGLSGRCAVFNRVYQANQGAVFDVHVQQGAIQFPPEPL